MSETATGTTTTSTLYIGSTTAEVQIPGESSSHGLTFSYTDGAITGASDTYSGNTTALTATDGAYTLGTEISLKVAEGAFADGALVASELTVTTSWNGGSDVSVSDTATDLSDGIKVNSNAAGNVVKWKFDDTHYYAFVIGTDGKVVNFEDTEKYPEESYTVDGITFKKGSALEFSTNGTEYDAIAATVTETSFEANGADNTPESAGTVTVTYNSGDLTIAPGSGVFTAAGEELASLTLGTASTIASTTKTNFKNSTGGSMGVTFTAPTFGTDVSAGGETYSIVFSGVKGYDAKGTQITATDGLVNYWQGDITVKVGTSTITFSLTTAVTPVSTAAGTVTFTDMMNEYVATWNDTTGDGVSTDDTITVVTTALSDTTKLTATAAATLDDTTYNLTASEVGVVTVTTSTDTTCP